MRVLARTVPIPLAILAALALMVIPMNFAHSPDELPPGQLLHAAGDTVTLRQLVIANDADDPGLKTWTSVLGKIGTPYDVLLARTEPLDRDRLVRADGVGRYGAVLLTDSALLTRDGSGKYVSGLDGVEWNTLWQYERAFHVRQVALRIAPGTFPEDYCLRPHTETAVGATPVEAALTDAGAQVFGYLRRDARVPIRDAYVYRTRVLAGCDASALLTLGSDALGVVSTAADGRERAGLTFSIGENQLVADLVGYGLLRWATRGIFLGEQRHWLNVDVDDWFAATLRGAPDGSGGTFRLSGSDAASVARQQAGLRSRYPLSGDFRLNIAFNGARLDPSAPAQCAADGTPDPLSSYSRCLVDDFRWINHTFSHPALNTTTYDENAAEIRKNLDVASAAGLPVEADVLKTPEYSGLGVYSADPGSLDTPVDHGLANANAELLRAAKDQGVKYLHGNMSFGSHRPACFNCGTYLPQQPDLFLVPDWPTNIAFEATTPDELTPIYNAAYGQGGSAPDHADHDHTYDEIIDAEAAIALTHLAGGSVFTHTLHQGNLHEYAPDRSLAFDWLAAVVGKYSALYSVPLENPDWRSLAGYAQARVAHFAELRTGRDAVWDRTAGVVTYTAAEDGSLFVTGLEAGSATMDGPRDRTAFTTYGSDTVATIGVAKGETVTLRAEARS